MVALRLAGRNGARELARGTADDQLINVLFALPKGLANSIAEPRHGTALA
jgi:hypothetical protein